MKKLTLLILLLSTMAFSQTFKIVSGPVDEIMKFKELPNDTVDVYVLYQSKMIEAKRVFKQLECIYDAYKKVEGDKFYKIDHYLIEGKKVDYKDVHYDSVINHTIIRASDINIMPYYGGGSLTHLLSD